MARRQGLTEEEIVWLRTRIRNDEHRRWVWVRLRIWGSWVVVGAPGMYALMEIARTLLASGH